MVLAVSCKKDDNTDPGKYGIDDVTPMPEAVDLGLSVKWASFNLGASKPEEYGDYYAWGEIATKQDYSKATYAYINSEKNKFTKYCPKEETLMWDMDAKPDGPDGEDHLLPEDDVVQVKLGGNWRMPTLSNIMELYSLLNNEDYFWDDRASVTINNGEEVHGLRITRISTGATLFLPSAGFCSGESLGEGAGERGNYWTSSLNTNIPSAAFYLYFYPGNSGWSSSPRKEGLSIRPVYVD